jgi:hypothetical protein
MTGFLIAAALAVAAAPPAPVVPTGESLTRAIVARDAEFFGLYFTGCDPGRLRNMLAPDVEFYHDQGGFAFRNADAMVADYARDCAAKKAPDAWRSRRALVPATLRVDPVPGYGAIEDGEHYFYERKGDGPEKRVGYGRFTIVWALAPDGWRMSRALSFAHRPAPEDAVADKPAKPRL